MYRCPNLAVCGKTCGKVYGTNVWHKENILNFKNDVVAQLADASYKRMTNYVTRFDEGQD